MGMPIARQTSHQSLYRSFSLVKVLVSPRKYVCRLTRSVTEHRGAYPIRKHHEFSRTDLLIKAKSKQYNTIIQYQQIILYTTMKSESLFRVTTQSWSDSCAMYRAEESIHRIIDSFGKKYLDIDVLGSIHNMLSLGSYDGALWSLMDAFQEEYIIEDDEQLLLLLEEAWKLLSQYQEGRVLSFKELQEEGGTSAQESMVSLVSDVERIIESCDLGLLRVREYRHGNMH